MNRFEELITATKIGEMMGKKQEAEKRSCKLCWILAIVGSVVAVAGISFAVYKILSAKKYEEFDDFDDDEFDDDFFEDDFAE